MALKTCRRQTFRELQLPVLCSLHLANVRNILGGVKSGPHARVPGLALDRLCSVRGAANLGEGPSSLWAPTFPAKSRENPMCLPGVFGERSKAARTGTTHCCCPKTGLRTRPRGPAGSGRCGLTPAACARGVSATSSVKPFAAAYPCGAVSGFCRVPHQTLSPPRVEPLAATLRPGALSNLGGIPGGYDALGFQNFGHVFLTDSELLEFWVCLSLCPQ